MDDLLSQPDPRTAAEDAELQARLDSAEKRKLEAEGRKRELDAQLAEFQKEEDTASINAIRDQLKS